MTFREPWYLLALALAQRLHTADPADPGGDPPWVMCERAARLLVTLYPDATRTEVCAALLHRTLDAGHGMRRLVQARVPGDVIVLIKMAQLEEPAPAVGSDVFRLQAAIAGAQASA